MRCHLNPQWFGYGAIAFIITIQEETVFRVSGAPGSFWKLLRSTEFHSGACIETGVLLALRNEKTGYRGHSSGQSPS